MRVRLLTLVAGLLLMTACKDEPRYVAGAAGASSDRQRLCESGGATFDATTNECVCDAGQSWGGLRCEAPVATLPSGIPPAAPSAVPQEETEAEEDASVAGEDMPPAFGQPGAAGSEPQGLTDQLTAACRRARGTWLAQDGYCHCPKDQVLVGRRCRTLPGRVTDDACLRAVSKGKWQSGDCRCDEGLVFSPARGGCVARFTGDVAVLRRVCESSLNLGKWEAKHSRCRCPAGRVWHDELCQVQQRLSSKAVCESDFNRGQWHADGKRCDCPSGFVWLDQGCRSGASISAERACTSETSGGRWNKTLDRCLCPGLTHWDGSTKSCR